MLFATEYIENTYVSTKEFAHLGRRFYPFKVDPFQKGIVHRKTSRPQKREKTYQVYPVPIKQDSSFV